jgi:transglutaminase-like putative cysteine protease
MEEPTSEKRRPSLVRRLVSHRAFFPLLVFIGLLIAFVASSRVTGRPPEIESISPTTGNAGDILTIRGSSFGDERGDGEVSIAGRSPTSSAYLEWSDTRISLRIPEDAGSGLVHVTTRNGRSEGHLFANRRHIPVLVSGPVAPGVPFVESVDPSRGEIGDAIEITGTNFGLSRGRGRVLFNWVVSEEQDTYKDGQVPRTVAARQRDSDYMEWTDRSIRVRVPDAASPGNIVVTTDKGTSNAVFFEIVDQPGTKTFLAKRTYTVYYAVEVYNAVGSAENGLYVWVPRIADTSSQRNIQVLTREMEPFYEDHAGVMLYRLENLERDDRFLLSQTFMVDCYGLETNVVGERVARGYDTERELYRVYTDSTETVPAADPALQAVVRSVVGRERNPYRAAQAIYTYVARSFTYEPPSEPRPIVESITAESGGAYEYALAFSTLARAAGIPARPVAGFVVDRRQQAYRHYWAEFYLPNFGWVPVDPALGADVLPVSAIELFGRQDSGAAADRPKYQDPLLFYFGNMDNHHIAFSHGVTELTSMDPRGKAVRHVESYSLQSVHEESVGLRRYSTRWQDIQVIGIF